MNYLIEYGQLPNNFITKGSQETWMVRRQFRTLRPRQMYWRRLFWQLRKSSPVVSGRTYHECDIDTLNAKSRGAKRIIYSDDGQIYYTDNHYKSFTLLYGDDVQ